MIKSHLEKVIVEQKVIDEVLCNCCGNPIHQNTFKDCQDMQGKISDFNELDDFLDVSKEWGYFSNHDEEIHKFHICQECYDKWVGGFKIPIEVKDCM